MIHLWSRLWRDRRWRRGFFRVRSRGYVHWALFLLGLVIALHTVLFYVFERPVQQGLSWFDSLWVTMTTITTVGYGDISAKTTAGRLTTMLLAYWTGLGFFAWFAGELTSRILVHSEEQRRGMKSVSVQEHLLLVNVPEVEKIKYCIEQLRSTRRFAEAPVVVISESLEALPFSLEEVYFVRGSNTSEQTFLRASVHSAQQAILFAEDPRAPKVDVTTVATVGLLERLAPNLRIVAECTREEHLPLFSSLGCAQVVLTSDTSVKMMVQESVDPGTSKVVAHLLDRKVGDEVYAEKLSEQWVGQPFQALCRCMVDSTLHVLPVGILRGLEALINPDPQLLLQKGDTLLCLSQERPDFSLLQPEEILRAESDAAS
ncbi:MAG: potassium channel family protein [Myxococcota bacterium]